MLITLKAIVAVSIDGRVMIMDIKDAAKIPNLGELAHLIDFIESEEPAGIYNVHIFINQKKRKIDIDYRTQLCELRNFNELWSGEVKLT